MVLKAMSAIDDLLRTLDLSVLEDNLFQGRSPDVGWTRIFGGLVVSQALVAAMRSVTAKLTPHSLHSYFILPGDPALPIDYEVEKLRDGRSFTTRRVVARQNGIAIFALSASFHVEEAGYEHQLPMPDVPDPEKLLSEKEIATKYKAHLSENIQRYFLRDRPIELRPIDLKRYLGLATPDGKSMSPTQNIWFRVTGPLPDDFTTHLAVLAYASDMTLIDTALVAHAKSVFNADIQGASLDHAMWFHRPFRMTDWMLYVQDSPSTFGALGLARGLIYTRDGRLVASVAQEGLIRPRPDRISPNK
jgi:acyl-CoA thioesterase II